MATSPLRAEELERELEQLLGRDVFPPPQEFRARALVRDDTPWREAERDPVGWWERQARELLEWSEPWQRALDDSNPPFYRWFVGGRLNACYNALDRHVAAGRGDRVAFHWRGEEGEERAVTYAELLHDAERLATVLRERGIAPGDVVGIYLPMIPEVAVAMLACARIGAVHNVVFGGFSVEALRDRLHFSNAKALICADGARRKGRKVAVKAGVDRILDDLPALRTVICVRHTGEAAPMRPDRDLWWHEALRAAGPTPAEPFDAEHPLFVLYTSGSTAKPKGVLHTTGGYLTGVAWTPRHVFDLRDDDIYWCTADVGWVTGHSYIVYGPLLAGATSVMYEGAPDYPDKDVWWEICARYGVTIFYTAPTAIRTCMKWGPEYPLRHDLSALRLLGSVGEPINPKAWLWYWRVIGGGRCPIVDTWWQTETGHILIAPLPGVTPLKPGSATRPLPGIDAAVVDDAGREVEPGQQGYLVLRRPWPGMLRTLYKDPERFVETYFSRFGRETYFVGDAARRDEEGYFWVVGRVDDVVNVSGHRLSTAEVESAIVAHPKVAEAAVIGQADERTGQAICAFVTVEAGVEPDERLADEIRAGVAERIGKLARPARIIWANDLPKTRSGKIMRRLLRDIAEGRALGDVTTLRDPAVIEQLEAKVRELRAAERS